MTTKVMISDESLSLRLQKGIPTSASTSTSTSSVTAVVLTDNDKVALAKANPVPRTDEMSVLYSQIRQSHTLYQLGVDQFGHPIHKNQSLFSKCSACYASCTSKGMDQTMKRQSNATQFLCQASPSKSIFKNDSKEARAERRKSRKSMSQSYKPRDNAFAYKYSVLVNKTSYKIFSCICSILALYVRDLTYALSPKTIDWLLLDVMLSLIFFWLMSELVLYSLTQTNYMFTFFFCLDVIGVASILIDIPWVMLGFGLSNNVFLIVKGGRMGRAARGAHSARLIKLVKMVRMVKLFRLIQLFRKSKNSNRGGAAAAAKKAQARKTKSGDQSNVSNIDYLTSKDANPTKMGSLLSDRVTQKVVLGVLLSFLILPLFDVSQIDTGAKTFLALENLEYIYAEYHNSSNGEFNVNSHALGDYNYALSNFYFYNSINIESSDANVLRLIIGNKYDTHQLIEIYNFDSGLRNEEQSQYETESGLSIAVLNIRAQVWEEAVLNMALTTFIMAIFAVGAFVISVDAFILVYPLEYLIVVLRRLTRISMQGNGNQDQAQGQGQSVPQSEMFNAIMQSMTDIFYAGKREQLFIDGLDYICDEDESEESSEEEDGNKQKQNKGKSTQECVMVSNLGSIELGDCPITIS